MPSHVRVGGVWRQAVPWVRAGGVWRQAQEGWVKVAGTWQRFYLALSVSASPSSVSGSRFGTGTVTTGVSTATPSTSGGTYSWRRVGGDTRAFAVNPGGAGSSFRITTLAAGEAVSAQFVCDYTLNGVTVTSNQVNANFTSTS